MLPSLLIISLGLASPVQAQDKALHQYVKDMGSSVVSTHAYFANGTELQDGSCRYFFDDGLFVPIHNKKNPDTPIGAVFVGEGRMQVDLKPHEAQALGNHLVLNAGMSREEAAELIANNRLEAPIEKGVLFSADPKVAALFVDLDKAGASYFEPGAAGEAATYVVTPRKGKLVAQAVARNLWPTRRDLLAQSGVELENSLGMEAVLNSAPEKSRSQGLFLADFMTPERFGAVLGTQNMIGSEDADRWLTCLRDGSGLLELGAYQSVFSHGLDAQEDYRHVQLAGLERTAPPPQDFTPIGATVEVDVQSRTRGRLLANTKSILSLRAERDGARHLLLRLPRENKVQEKWEMPAPTLIDGTPVKWTVLEVEESEQLSKQSSQATLRLMNPAKALHHDLLIELPRAMRKDEAVSIKLNWQCQWLLGNWAASSSGQVQLGPTTGPLRFLPDLLPLEGNDPWSFSIIVKAKARRGLDIAVSGDTLEEYLDEDTLERTVEAGALHAHEPRLVLGRWRSYQEAAARSFPAVQALLLPGQAASSLQEFPAEVRRILYYYDRFLPSIEIPELEVYQNADRPSVGLEETGHGLLEVHQVFQPDRTRLDKYDPDVGQAILARSIANQYWSHLVHPAGQQDAWMPTVLSEIFAAYYLRNINGVSSYLDRIQALQDLLEDAAEQENTFGSATTAWNETPSGKKASGPGENLSLTRFSSADLLTPDLARYYGLVVIGEMLRSQMNDAEFFTALDSLIRDHRGRAITSKDFQNAMEDSSKKNLGDFFDFWIHGGLIPSIDLKYSEQKDGVLVACLETNIPFGSFNVPLSVETQEQKLAPVIQVKNGHGRLHMKIDGPLEQVVVDPDRLILATTRKATQSDSLDCPENTPADAPKAP